MTDVPLKLRFRPGLTSLLIALVGLSPAALQATLTVHTYSYNVDGALTAITTQVDDQPSTTNYLTWDNFTPDATAPTGGTVAAGDGRLIGYGPSPDNLTARFTFDPRDRLVSYSGDAGNETYDYHALGMMKSASTDADERRFYFDASENPQATNLHDGASDRWSAWLDHTRFLDDGNEQILLAPRKDMACSYDAANETLQSFVYDAFGASPSPGTPSDTYDLEDNPFRYAGEYRDPLWGGYFLRARWYHPDLPTFLSRDPEGHLNRYAYGAGNPVMNTDPSGFGVGSSLRRLDAKLNAGIGGHFARIFLAPLLGPLQIVAYPKQFVEAVAKDKGGIDIFLAVGILSEGVGGLADLAYAGYGVRLATRFGLRSLSDNLIGVASSVTAGASHGFGHFDWNAFGQGLEYTASPFITRGLTGLNVRTGFRLTADDLANKFEELRNAPNGTALVFRERTSIGGGANSLRSGASSTSGLIGTGPGFDKPFTQALHWSYYHERLIALTKDDLFMNDAVDEGVRVSQDRFGRAGFNNMKKLLTRFKGKYEFVGKVDHFYTPAGRQAFLANPYNVNVLTNRGTPFSTLRTRGGEAQTYGPLFNNCQYHAYAVLKDMGLR